MYIQSIIIIVIIIIIIIIIKGEGQWGSDAAGSVETTHSLVGWPD